MIEDRAERPQFRGIPLVTSEDDVFIVHEDCFESKPRFIPEIGNVYLAGTRSFKYDDNVQGIAVIDGELSIMSASNFERKGLFELSVGTISRQRPVREDLICLMQTPTNVGNIVLKSILRFSVDEIEKDPKVKYYAIVDGWAIAGIEEVYFFVSYDPQFLSQLRFSFESVSQASIIQPTEE